MREEFYPRTIFDTNLGAYGGLTNRPLDSGLIVEEEEAGKRHFL